MKLEGLLTSNIWQVEHGLVHFLSSKEALKLCGGDHGSGSTA